MEKIPVTGVLSNVWIVGIVSGIVSGVVVCFLSGLVWAWCYRFAQGETTLAERMLRWLNIRG